MHYDFVRDINCPSGIHFATISTCSFSDTVRSKYVLNETFPKKYSRIKILCAVLENY